ncbi:hypothetical protein QTP88_008899 [Uroleucon formosanum]
MTKSFVRVENLPKTEIYLLQLIIAQKISLLRTENHNIIYNSPHLFLSSRRLLNSMLVQLVEIWLIFFSFFLLRGISGDVSDADIYTCIMVMEWRHVQSYIIWWKYFLTITIWML